MLILLKTFSFAVTVAYLIAWLRYLSVFTKKTEQEKKPAHLAVPVALILHAVYLAAIMVFMRHPPYTNVFEATSVLALMLVTIYQFVEKRGSTKSPGITIYFLAFLMQLISSIFIKFAPGMPDILGSKLMVIHVSLALMGYTAFTIAFLYSVMYLLLNHEIRARRFGFIYSTLPPLEELDELNFTASVAGLLLLFASIIAGFALTMVQMGRFPFTDPKVMTTIFTWSVYLVILVFKTQLGWRGKRIAILSVCGFLLVIASLSVSLVIPQSFHGIF